MREVCFCGRRDGRDYGSRADSLDESGRWALRCRSCGHTDYLEWLSEEAGLVLWGEAKRCRELSVGQGRFAT